MKTTVLVAAIVAGLAVQSVSAQERRGEPMDFATLDADSNGAITIEEMEAAAAARFALADTDGDGGLSAEELVAQRTADQIERAQARAEEMVAHLDDNGDGVLQADELQDARRPFSRMFDRVDADDDGSISEAEFDTMQERRNGGGRDGGHGRDGGRDRG